MKQTTDRKQLANGKKTVYPTKHTMNLYFKVDRTTAPATAALYILFAAVIVLALGKVLVYDPLNAAKQLENQAALLEEQTAVKFEQLKDYEQILEDYVRATPTKEERTQVDRMEVLNLIDRTIRPAAKISKVSVLEDQVLLSFSGVTLREAAGLVAQLEESPLVTGVSVDTAASTREDQSLVEVHVYFELVREEARK